MPSAAMWRTCPANRRRPAARCRTALLTKFSQSIRELERNWDYHDYQIAVLQPGLSPEQRRLLFGGALERLALPLPGASLWFGVL